VKPWVQGQRPGFLKGLVLAGVYRRPKGRRQFDFDSFYRLGYRQFYMRSPYRQVIAAVLIAGLFVLAVPDEVWADDPEPLPDLVYYHNDHLGSSSIITNGDYGHKGDFVHQYVYTPYGDESYADVTYKNVSNRYTGQVLDEETGLYYYNARYYDPEIGRFTQADSEFATGSPDSQALNRYSYCLNNPLIYTDPTGNFLGIDDLIVLGIVAGGILGGAQSSAIGGNFWEGAWKGAVAGGIGGAMITFGVPVLQPLMGEALATMTCAAGGGALSAAITGGDPGMSAIIGGITAGIGIRLGFGHPSLLDPGQWGQYIKELVLSAGVSAVVGGTVAEIQGANFWQGASDAAIWGAAGYVLTSILNKDYGQEGRTLWDEFLDIFEGGLGVKFGLEVKAKVGPAEVAVGGGVGNVPLKLEHAEITSVAEKNIGATIKVGTKKIGFEYSKETPVDMGKPISAKAQRSITIGYNKIKATPWKIKTSLTVGIVKVDAGVNLSEIYDFGRHASYRAAGVLARWEMQARRMVGIPY